jgi:hypothetical protein
LCTRSPILGSVVVAVTLPQHVHEVINRTQPLRPQRARHCCAPPVRL